MSAVAGSAEARAFIEGTNPAPSSPARPAPGRPDSYERRLRELPGVPVSLLPRALYKATGGRIRLGGRTRAG
ncbi:hypothetical protein FZ103_19240 [Streptomonospora sp. PA3]|uniref:hypothetical protein n=1 Tax=Streptomonospora sp. PA3 TaxID=2607326 RepID=UPI0012DFA618|nr:hypothetical protein [Streptomonospora sp. PA3]MUL43275.1 hypothetical protein [Streptomonospora sp. PA3]